MVKVGDQGGHQRHKGKKYGKNFRADYIGKGSHYPVQQVGAVFG